MDLHENAFESHKMMHAFDGVKCKNREFRNFNGLGFNGLRRYSLLECLSKFTMLLQIRNEKLK